MSMKTEKKVAKCGIEKLRKIQEKYPFCKKMSKKKFFVTALFYGKKKTKIKDQEKPVNFLAQTCGMLQRIEM